MTAAADVLKLPASAIGRAAMRCRVGDEGQLSECRLILESPMNVGLGPLLLSLSDKYRRRPPQPGDARDVSIIVDNQPIDSPADWVKQPTGRDVLSVFPTEAYKNGISGSALLTCAVTLQGALNECIVEEEFPGGMGFGSAAVALAPQFTMKPARFNGVPTKTTVRIPIRFKTQGKGRSVSSGSKILPVNLAWTEAPSYGDVLAAYPKRAMEKKLGGRSTLACQMTVEGRLSECWAIKPDATNYGFDTAAKALAKKFRMDLSSAADKSAAKTLQVHIPFTFDPSMLNATIPIVGKPTWSRLPDGQEMQAAFDALKVNGTVRTTLACVVEQGGSLGDCKVESETPVGSGAGSVGLGMARLFRVSTWTTEGLPTVGGNIRVPLRYEAGQVVPPPPK